MTAALDWTEAVSNVSQVETYELYKSVNTYPDDPDFLTSFTKIATLEVERDEFGEITNDPTTYNDADVDFNTNFYHYYVLAVPVRVGESNTPSEPPTRSNILPLTFSMTSFTLTLDSETVNQTDLSWGQPTTFLVALDNYKLYRTVDGGDPELLTTIPAAGTRSYSDTDVDRRANSYEYYVVATDEVLQTSQSNTVTAPEIRLIQDVFLASDTFNVPSDIFNSQIEDVLVVAGGGGAGGGGGGAGGVIHQQDFAVTPGAMIAVTVGSGGSGVSGGSNGGNGGNSIFDSITAIGGGGGSHSGDGEDGGSGGGGGGVGSGLGGSATPGQGNDGGDGVDGGPSNRWHGGGGGAGQVGDDASIGVLANGGDGVDLSATFGSDVGDMGWFGGGGGGGGANSGDAGNGGMGGGAVGAAANGAANTGAGGNGQGAGGEAGDGGSGIVILRYWIPA